MSRAAVPQSSKAHGGHARADALFCVVHDVLQTPAAALRATVEHPRPGTAVAVTGGTQPGLWLRPLRPSVTHPHTHTPVAESLENLR